METNAQFFTEWRDTAAHPQNVGPSLRFDGTGQVTVGGKTIATVPSREWVHVEIEAAVGRNTPRRFKLTLTPRGEAPQVFVDLPVNGQQFTELHWLGFSSTAAADTMVFLDNVRIR